MEKVRKIGSGTMYLLLLLTVSCKGQSQLSAAINNQHISFAHIAKNHDKTYGLLKICPKNSTIKNSYDYFVDTGIYKYMISYIKEYHDTIQDSSSRKMEPGCWYCYNVTVRSEDSVYSQYDLINDSETQKYFIGFIKLFEGDNTYKELVEDIQGRVGIIK
jgi:phosphomevalonate kinase